MQLFLWIYCDKGFRKYSSRFQLWSTEIRCQGMIFYVNLDCCFIEARGSPCRQATMALKSNQVHQLPPSPWQDDNSFKESRSTILSISAKTNNHISPHTQARPWHMALKTRSWLRTGIQMWRRLKQLLWSQALIIWSPNSNTDINTINDFDFWCFNATFSSISTISWWPVLVVEEARENHRPWASNW